MSGAYLLVFRLAYMCTIYHVQTLHDSHHNANILIFNIIMHVCLKIQIIRKKRLLVYSSVIDVVITINIQLPKIIIFRLTI